MISATATATTTTTPTATTPAALFSPVTYNVTQNHGHYERRYKASSPETLEGSRITRQAPSPTEVRRVLTRQFFPQRIRLTLKGCKKSVKVTSHEVQNDESFSFL